VLGAAADRRASHRMVAVIAVVALLSFLIFSRPPELALAAGLMVSVPVPSRGAGRAAGRRTAIIGVLVALFALLALALRQTLVFVRRARELRSRRCHLNQAVHQALREGAPGRRRRAADGGAPCRSGRRWAARRAWSCCPFAVSMLAGLITSIGSA
jgi:Cu/Ag efflux pump CusA